MMYIIQLALHAHLCYATANTWETIKKIGLCQKKYQLKMLPQNSYKI